MRKLVLILMVCQASLFSQGKNDATTRHETIGPPSVPPGPHWWDFIYDPGFPAAARRELEPLYIEHDRLIQHLALNAPGDALDLAWNILGAMEAMQSKAPDLLGSIATGLSRKNGIPDTPVEPNSSQEDLLAIQKIAEQIREIRRRYNVESTIGPASTGTPSAIQWMPTIEQIKGWLAEYESGCYQDRWVKISCSAPCSYGPGGRQCVYYNPASFAKECEQAKARCIEAKGKKQKGR